MTRESTLTRQASTATADAGHPIFIIGMMQRVGTNFLARALARHPDCTAPATMHEDYLLTELGLLDDYVRLISRRWTKDWGAREKAPDLRRRLGASLTAFAQADAKEPGKRLILKTPNLKGVKHAPAFLGNHRVIILVRNGTDVVESAMRSFGWSFEQACERWKKGVHELIEIVGDIEHPPDNVLVVRYEDLLSDPQASFRRVLEFAGLDPAAFDIGEIARMPVYGSSTERGGKEKVHWGPVRKTAGFDPLKRSAAWRADAIDRFDWLTESASAMLGYELPRDIPDSPRRRLVHRIRDQKRRLPWRVQQRLRYVPTP